MFRALNGTDERWDRFRKDKVLMRFIREPQPVPTLNRRSAEKMLKRFIVLASRAELAIRSEQGIGEESSCLSLPFPPPPAPGGAAARAALSTPAAAPPPVADSPPATGLPPPPSSDELKRLVAGSRALQACYAAAVKEDPGLPGGIVAVKAVIAPAGMVTRFSTKGPPELQVIDPCIKAAVSALPFPISREEYGVEFNLDCQAP